MWPAILNTGRFLLRHPLTCDHKWQSLTRFAKWQLLSRLCDEAVVPWIEGMNLIVRKGMTGATGNIYAGLHEFADMGFTLHFLRAGDLFIDIGSNIGSYTVLASGVRRARTIAFEPDPDIAWSLRKNIEANAIGTLVSVHEIALGRTRGSVHFTRGLGTLNKVAAPGSGATRIVKMSTLDSILGGKAPVLIKIDTEGYEVEVLAGASEVLNAQSLKAILTENCSNSITEILYKFGFSRLYYDPFTRELKSSHELNYHANGLFVRDLTLTQRRLTEAPNFTVLGKII